jgi:type I site-specific restriction endonuclease
MQRYIQAVELALANNQRYRSLAMATGTGKTCTTWLADGTGLI